MRLRLRTLLYNSLLVAIVSTTFGPGFLLSQTVPQGPAFGITPFGSYHGYQVDTVNMDNGNDIIKIPLFSLPQLGKLALSFSAVSNITYWELAGGCSPDGLSCNYYYTNNTPAYNAISQNVGIGPAVVPDQIPSVGLTNELTFDSGLNYAYVNWSVADNTGGSHPLLYDAANPSQLRSADGSGYLFKTNSSQPYNFNAPSPTVWTVIGPNGTKTVQTFHTEGPNYTTVQSDVSGNSITYTSPSGSTVQGFFKDSLQRTIPDIPYPTSSITGCPNLNQPSQPATASSLWSVPGPNDTTATFLVCYAQVYYHTNLLGNGGQSVCLPNGDGQTCYSEAVGGAEAIQSISLPDGTYWGFVYDSANPSDSSSLANATLSQLILPQGGSISYNYYPSGICYSNQQDWQTLALHSRTVTDINGKTKVWNYSINQNSGGGNPTGNIVTDPDGNDTVYLFQDFIAPPFSCSDLETSRTTYQGSAPATVLKAETVDQYQQVTAPSPFASQYYHGYANAFRKNQTTTLNGTVSAKSSTGYDTSTFTAITPSCQLSTDGTCPRRDGDSAGLSLGMPTATSVTDYSGSVLNSTSTVYAWQSGSSGVCPATGYYSGNLLNTPSQVTTFDNNNQAAQTTLTYDEGTYDPSANCGKGHVTTKLMWNNMGANLQTHTAWTTSGMVDHTIDSNNNTTQYNYDTTGIFPSSVQRPTTNGVTHVDYYAWDANTGNMTSHTDENSVVTKYFYNDPLGRLKLVESAFGALDASGQSAESMTSYNYPSATEVDITQDQSATGDQVLQSHIFYDGLGHPVKTTGRDGSIVETAYDGFDRACAVSYPSFSDPGVLSCTAAQNPAGGEITYYTYDGAGRLAQQTTQPDNVSLHWGYNANTILFTDENQNQWQQTIDALNRITNVAENDPTSGALTLNTSYQYDALGDLHCVDQWGSATPGQPCQGTSSRPRIFHYDSLSRLTSATNPESGTVTYGYITPGGSLCSGDPSSACNKTDARGVTTTYSYDNLNRVLSKTYSGDTITPSAQFTYDTSSVSGSVNTKGHLTSESTSFGGAIKTQRQLYYYHPLGRLQYEQQCASGNCSGTPNMLAYNYNLAGDIVSSTNGMSTSGVSAQLSYGYDSGERLASVTSNWPADANHPNPLFCATTAPVNGCPAASQGTYNAAKQLTYAQLAFNSQQAAMSITRTYDGRLRPVTETVLGQSGAGMPASATVNVTGTEQSIGGGGTATPATGTISLSYSGGQQALHQAVPLFASSSITLPDGYHASFIASTNSAIATANNLAAVLNSAFSPVTAVVASGGTASAASIQLTTKATGADQNGAITLSMVATQVRAAPASLTGGGGTTYDTGTVTANINGTAVTTTYGQSSTPQSVAAALATAITGAGAGVTATANASGAITVTASQGGTAANGWPVALSSATGEPKYFSAPSFSGTSGTLGGGTAGSAGPIYGYTIPGPGSPTGYDLHGNLMSFSDCVSGDCVTNGCGTSGCVMGTWSMHYDKLNRVSSGTATAGPYGPAQAGMNGLTLAWGYDVFGNRQTQTPSGDPATPAPPAQTLNYISNNNNRIDNYGSGSYDAAGNVLYDLVNHYIYDAEGRLCAVSNPDRGNEQYLYDAEGRRVAKSTGGSFSCDVTNLTPTESYLLGQSGELITELGPSGSFLRTHVYANGQLLATYTKDSTKDTTEFAISDWLGTKRIVAGANGQIVGNCLSLPFGDALSCSNTVSLNGHHFTGQVHDYTSGNDYFGARYYGEYTGRFLSPDLLGGHLENPQSLNKYVYALNNPLTNTDPTGLDSYLQCTSTADNASTCQSQTVGYDSKGNAQMATVQGVTGQNGQFTATQIGNDANGNLVDKTTGTGGYTASVNGSGVQFSNNGGQSYSSGVFVNGTPQTTFQDAGFANGGALSGFNFTLTNSKLEANQTEAGYFSFGGTPAQAGAALQQAGFNPRYGTEGGNEYRSPGSGLTGANSGHFIVNPNILLDPGVTLPVAGGSMHFGEHSFGFNPISDILHCVSDGAGVCQ